MRRWEREEHDARLDGCAVKGEPCPWCGDASKEGHGPCSEACEAAMTSADTERPDPTYVACAATEGCISRASYDDGRCGYHTSSFVRRTA
jgi:hypothetical protein